MRPLNDAVRTWRCRRRWQQGREAGDWIPVFQPWSSAALESDFAVMVLLPDSSSATVPNAGARIQAQAWCRRQTLPALGLCDAGQGAGKSFAFYAPGRRLPDLDSSFVEAALMILAAQDIAAVSLGVPSSTDEAVIGPRHLTVFRSDAFNYDPTTDQVIPQRRRYLTQWIDSATPAPNPGDAMAEPSSQRRRGPFRASYDLPGRLRLGVRDVHRLFVEALPKASHSAATHSPATHRPVARGKIPMLVMAPFLARGGAEQTLYATLDHLGDRFDYTFVTLAPHRAALGDRRDDFRRLSPRLFSLGDWVHPAAMVGMIRYLIDSTGARVLYNANGTTLFYDFAPQLKAAYPDLRILDHLYDHRVGYIEAYDAPLLQAVDTCVAENHPIQRQLSKQGWPTERAPVIWPCGRAATALPDDPQAVRDTVRRELDIDDDRVVFLVAARLHAQKRPLDFVALAQRCADLPQALFLWVGGGELDDAMQSAIDEALVAEPRTAIHRLPFRDDIPRLICAADVGCLVSEYEGLPVFLLECLQLGRPFLGTDVGELGRVVRDSGAGRVVETPGNLDDLERQVRQLMDPELRRDLGRRALSAAEHFSVAACAERYAQAFLGEPLPSLDGVLGESDGAP